MARNDYPETDASSIAGYNPSPEETKCIKFLQKKFESAKQSKKNRTPRWRRNEELYNGQFLKPFNLPKYKSRIEPNVIHSVVETIYSILTDRNPKVDIMPKREDQIDSARQSQEIVEAEMEKRKMHKAVAGMKRDGLIYGNGFVKPTIVDGVLEYVVPDPYTVFFDPLATSIKNAKCVIFATPTYISDIREDFENGKYVTAEGKLNEFRSFVKFKDTYATNKTRGVQLDVDEQSPAYGKGDGDEYGIGQSLLKEAWYYENNQLYVSTWCGNVLLQKEVAPYEFIPLVTFQNYKSAHSIWGKGEPEIVESLAVGSSISLSQALDNLIYHGNPSVVMSKSMMKTVGNRPTDKPGQIYYTNGPHENVTRLPAGNISGSSLPMSQSLLALVDQVSGVHDITQGRNPAGVTSGTAINQLQEASQQIIRTKEREVGQDAVIDLYKFTLSMLKNNYESNIEVRNFSDISGKYEFDEVSPYDIEVDLDFKYVPGSSLPENRASRFDQALQMAQMGLLNPEQFWRWTQKDISKEILDEIMEQKRIQQEEMEADQQILEESTDKEQIMNTLMKQRAMAGALDSENQQGE